MIRGIGPAYVKKMVKAFGEKMFNVIEAAPDRLTRGARPSAAAPLPHSPPTDRTGCGPPMTKLGQRQSSDADRRFRIIT